MQPKFFVIISVVGLVIYFIMKPDSSNLQSKSPDTGSSTDKPKAIVVDKQTRKNINSRKKRIDRLRRQYKKELKLGIHGEPFPSSNGKVTVGVTFKPRKQWCQLGELDFIKDQLQSNKNRKLLLTIEDIGQDDVLFKKQISAQALEDESSFFASIPEGAKQRGLGVFLCTARNDSESCRGKKAATFDENMTRDFLQGKNSGTSDRIYYFQTIFLQKNIVKVPPTLLKDKSYFKSLAGILPSDIGRKVSAYAYKNSKDLGNYPPKVGGGKLSITLPYNDPRCNINVRGH